MIAFTPIAPALDRELVIHVDLMSRHVDDRGAHIYRLENALSPNVVVLPQRFDILLACPEDSNSVLNGHHHSIAPSSPPMLGRYSPTWVNVREEFVDRPANLLDRRVRVPALSQQPSKPFLPRRLATVFRRI